MRFTSRVSLIDFDLAGYRGHLDEIMTETVKDAARSWLQTVLVIIPTWSRASRATFNELAEAVGFNLTFGPIRSRKDRLNLGLGTSRGGLKIDAGKSWFFFYETNLQYLAYNEFNKATFGTAPNVFSPRGIPNTPYRFTEAGANDFQSFSQSVRLPNPIEFIRGRRI